MSESDSKKQIRGLIESVAPERYWVTRDTRDGKLHSYVDVWLVRPDRLRFPEGDVIWMIPVNTDDSAHWCRWTIAQATVELRGAVPQTDMECVVVGHDDESVS